MVIWQTNRTGALIIIHGNEIILVETFICMLNQKIPYKTGKEITKFVIVFCVMRQNIAFSRLSR